MVTYEEAYKIAQELKTKIDACDEYDVGYAFKSKDDEWNIGGEGACCIIKESGRAVNQTEFYDMYNPVFIKEINVSTE